MRLAPIDACQKQFGDLNAKWPWGLPVSAAEGNMSRTARSQRTSTHRLAHWVIAHAAGLGVATTAFPALALPVLGGNQFFATSAATSATPWTYTGTLPSSLSAGFRLKNIDDDIFGDSGNQYSNGSRTASTTLGASPTYGLALKGNFEYATKSLWESNILAQSKGQVQSDDIDGRSFVPPSGVTTNEHPIPSSWQSSFGYATPGGSFAQFSRTITPRTYLLPGESGCPSSLAPGGVKTDICTFTGAYFKGGANLGASLKAHGDVHEVGSNNFTAQAKADRIATLKVNGDPLRSTTVTGSASSFSLQEDEITDLNFSFSVNDNGVSGSIGAKWTARDDVGSMDASYMQRMDMADYAYVGKAEQYLVELRDEASLEAGITGTDFVMGSVEASMTLSGLDAVLAPVYQPVTAGMLDVKAYYRLLGLDGSGGLDIPAGGFQRDVGGTLQMLLTNTGGLDLTVDSVSLDLLDSDFLLDDDLLKLLLPTSVHLLPGETRTLSYGLNVPVSRLRNADDGFEMGELDLEATGRAVFHDFYGSRTTTYTAVPVPEPASLALTALALMLMRSVKRIRTKSGHALQ